MRLNKSYNHNLEREKRLSLIKSLEPQLELLSNFELKVLLIRNGCEIYFEDKENLIKDILKIIPPNEIKKDLNEFSRIRNITDSLISLSFIEFDVLLAIYNLDLNGMDKEDQILNIFRRKKLVKLEEDLLNFDKIRLLILRLDDLNDLEFKILFKNINSTNLVDVFREYSIETITHELNSLNHVRSFISEFNQLSIFEIDNLLASQSIEIEGVKNDKIIYIFDKYSFSEIRALLDNINKIRDIRESLEDFSSFELNMLLLINGKAISHSRERQINKIFKEISLSYLSKDIIRIKNLNKLHNSEFLLVKEGLKKSSFKDLSKFVSSDSNTSHDLKSLFNQAYQIILDNYDLVPDNNVKNNSNPKKNKNQSSLDLFF